MPSPATTVPERRSVALVTLGCARNEVDSEELAGRLADAGWTLVDDAADADVAVVNTCGFVEQAKKDSVDALLEASDLQGRHPPHPGGRRRRLPGRALRDRARRPAARGRRGARLRRYADLSGHLDAVLHGDTPASHVPRDRRTLLPLSPSARQPRRPTSPCPGHAVPAPPRPPARAGAGLRAAGGPRRLDGRPWAPLKLASGCDRRCTFCAIPAFRGSFVSPPTGRGARRGPLARRPGRARDASSSARTPRPTARTSATSGCWRPCCRSSRRRGHRPGPGLLPAARRGATRSARGDRAARPASSPYFDLSFQHGAPAVLRRMRRFGGTEPFLEPGRAGPRARARRPASAPTSSSASPARPRTSSPSWRRSCERARLDVVGVFGYSDEDGTEAQKLDGRHDADDRGRALRVTTDLVEELTDQRAEERVGEQVDVLVEAIDEDGVLGRTGRATRAPTSTARPRWWGSGPPRSPSATSWRPSSSAPRASTWSPSHVP